MHIYTCIYVYTHTQIYIMHMFQIEKIWIQFLSNLYDGIKAEHIIKHIYSIDFRKYLLLYISGHRDIMHFQTIPYKWSKCSQLCRLKKYHCSPILCGSCLAMKQWCTILRHDSWIQNSFSHDVLSFHKDIIWKICFSKVLITFYYCSHACSC